MINTNLVKNLDVGIRRVNSAELYMGIFQSGQHAELSITIVLIVTMLKIIGFLASKVVGEKSVLTRKEQGQLDELHRLVTAKDGDGMPLFYVPRSWANLQTSILDKMEKITRHQERMTYTMETVVSAIDKMLERELKK